MYLTKFTIGLRVSKDGELEGLDLHERIRRRRLPGAALGGIIGSHAASAHASSSSRPARRFPPRPSNGEEAAHQES